VIIWWARRPLAASRATAFAALLDDPGPGVPPPPDARRADDKPYEDMREYLMERLLPGVA